MKAFYQLWDDNDDGLNDCFMILTKEFGMPLIGDYRGVRLAVIPFSNKDGQKQAEDLARIYIKALSKYDSPFIVR